MGPNADCADVLCALSVLCGKSPFFRCYLCVHCVNDLPARSVSRHEFVRAETIPKPLSSRPRTKELATEEEWRDPEAVSSPMPIQGVSTRTSSPLVPYARFAGIDRSLQVTFSDSAPVATLHPLRNAFCSVCTAPRALSILCGKRPFFRCDLCVHCGK